MLELYLVLTLVALSLIVAIAWILFVVGSLRAESKSLDKEINESKEEIKLIRFRLHNLEGSIASSEESLIQLLDRMEEILDKNTVK